MTDYGSARGLARVGVAGCVLASLTLLAACATEQAVEALPDMPAPPPMELASIPPAPVPRFERLPEPPPEPPAEIPPPEPEPPPPPLPTPTDAQSLRAAYGTPAFIRREPDSELWRYDGAMCAAFFFLYLDSGTYRIRHSETTPRGQDVPADEGCLRSLIPSEIASPAGGM
jgi:hypothetical protein